MKASDLIRQSQASLSNMPPNKNIKFNFFTQGAKWMHQQMQSISRNPPTEFEETINYEFYGYLKYLVAISCFVGSFLLLPKSFYRFPISVFFFYLAEVHFLFLFPLLIEREAKPLRKSIAMTYRIGIVQALWVVLPIGFYMLFGLLNVKNPFYNWYVGCLAIIIWYAHEVRDRV